jgi:hypothetical protein
LEQSLLELRVISAQIINTWIFSWGHVASALALALGISWGHEMPFFRPKNILQNINVFFTNPVV